MSDWNSNQYLRFNKERTRPSLDILSEDEKELFINDLKNEIKNTYKPLNDGKVFLIMPRLFFIANK